MAVDVKLPELGDGIDSGDVLEVLVAEGDVIAKDQSIVELETDKATVSVPSSHAGKVVKIHVAEGESVPIGGVLITVEAEAEAEQGNAQASPAPPTAAEEPATETEAETEESATEDSQESDSAPQSRPASEPAPAPPRETAKPATATAVSAPETENGGPIPASPSVRRFAREVGVDLQGVTGSGPNGRITREDVLEVVRGGQRQAARGAAPAPSEKARAGQAQAGQAQGASRSGQPRAVTPPGEAGEDNWGPVRIAKMSKIRRTIAARMAESWSTAPRVTNFDDADITELEHIRQQSKDDYAALGIKLTSMPFIVKAVALALRAHPAINANVDLEKDQIIYKDYVNIGIAVDTERGLVVPSLRAADQLRIPEIARELSALAERTRGGEFTIEELRGSTFTISNLGAIGGTYSTPIINVPEVAILLVGRARKLPVVLEDDRIAARLMLPLSLAYDHRLVDGATAARFLNDVIGFLEAPSRLLLAP